MTYILLSCKFDTYVFMNQVSKLKKNERSDLFYFKTLFFLYQSEKISLLKDTDAAKFEEVNKVKLYILQIIFQRKVGYYLYQKKLLLRLVSVFVCLFVCFFEKGLTDFDWFICTTLSNPFLLSPWMQSLLPCLKKRCRTYLKIFQTVKFKFL